MTVHATSYSLLFNLQSSAPTDDRNNKPFVQDVDVPTSNTASDEIPQPSIPLNAFKGSNAVGPGTDNPVKRANLTYRTDAPAQASLINVSNDNIWAVDGPATLNSTVPGFSYNSSNGGSRAQPSIAARYSGDASTALPGGTAINIVGQIEYSQPKYYGPCAAMDFQDSANTEADEIGALYTAIKSGGSNRSLGTTSSGGELIVQSCNWTGLAPEGAVYITPSDIGTNVEQIANDVTANTADKFRFHPSVFIRKSPNLQSIVTGYRDDVALTATSQDNPIRIVQVTSAPAYSRWMFVIDGHIVLARLDHGNQDLRRPRDIWNTLIVPLINGSQSTGNAARLADLEGNEGRVLINKWQFLQYARCLPLAGTRYIQDGAEG